MEELKHINLENNEEVIWDGQEIPVSENIRPVDYESEVKRGTLNYSPDWKNYSFHDVVIPDGTEVRDCNFAQHQANTDCITGENLIFIDCNLVNVKLHGSWTLLGCNNTQK